MKNWIFYILKKIKRRVFKILKKLNQNKRWYIKYLLSIHGEKPKENYKKNI